MFLRLGNTGWYVVTTSEAIFFQWDCGGSLQPEGVLWNLVIFSSNDFSEELVFRSLRLHFESFSDPCWVACVLESLCRFKARADGCRISRLFAVPRWPEPAMSDVGCRMSDVGCRMSDVGCRMSDVGCRMSDVGCRMSDVGCRMSDVGCRMSDVGCRMSDVGCLVSVFGCRILTARCRTFTSRMSDVRF